MGNVLISVVFVFMGITGLDLNLSRAEEEGGTGFKRCSFEMEATTIHSEREGSKEGSCDQENNNEMMRKKVL